VKVSAIISFVISLPILIISGISLLSKTDFESAFLTNDQVLKKRYLGMGEIAFFLTYVIILFYTLWMIFVLKVKYELINKVDIAFIAISTFIIIFILLIISSKKLSNFFVKNKTVFKVSIENLGEVYIIKMFDHTTCICSKNAFVNLNDSNQQLYLVRIEDMMKLPITKEIVSIPTRSIYQKLFD